MRKDSPHQVSQSCIHFLDLHLQRSFVLGYLAIYNLMLTEQTDCNDNVFNGDLKVTPELIRKVKIRATYSCDEESTCYLHPDGLLVCVNLQTGEITHPYPSTQSPKGSKLTLFRRLYQRAWSQWQCYHWGVYSSKRRHKLCGS